MDCLPLNIHFARHTKDLDLAKPRESIREGVNEKAKKIGRRGGREGRIEWRLRLRSLVGRRVQPRDLVWYLKVRISFVGQL